MMYSKLEGGLQWGLSATCLPAHVCMHAHIHKQTNTHTHTHTHTHTQIPQQQSFDDHVRTDAHIMFLYYPLIIAVIFHICFQFLSR